MIWTRPKEFGPNQNNLDLTKKICTRPKQLGWFKINFGPIERQGITLKTTMFLIQDQQTGFKLFKSKSNELVNFIEKSYHSYLLVRIRLWQNSFVLEEDFKENTNYQRIRMAKRTDKICFCLSLFLNAVFLICTVIISAI